MDLEKSEPSARKIGSRFLVAQVFLVSNNVISRSSLSIDVQNLNFRPEIIVICKRKIFTFN